MDRPTLTRLYWVRHGENRANLTKELSSRRVDYPLTAKGVLQAEQTAAHFASLPIAAIYASPLLRARQTAEIIAARRKQPVTVLDAFREIDVGALEGQPPTAALWAEHNRIFDDWLAGRYQSAFPGGDDYATLWRRFSAGLHEIVRQPGQIVIVVGHGGSFAVSLQQMCPPETLHSLRGKDLHNCSISELQLAHSEGQWRADIVQWGSVAHLHGEAAALVSGLPQAGELPEKE